MIDQSAFTANLLRTITLLDQEYRNLVCSPLSIQSAMTLCMVGARGDTLKEMMDVLFPNDCPQDITVDGVCIQMICIQMIISDLMKLCKHYNTEYPFTFWDVDSDDQQPVLIIANKVWIANDHHILDSYVVAAGEDAVGSFNKSEGLKSADIVNQWITQSTNMMVPEIVDEQIMSDSDLVITNAIYFSGKFVVPFLLKDTEKNVSFYTDGITKVDMMYSKAKRSIAQKVNGLWDVVKLKYANSALSMFLVMNSHGEGDEAELSTNDVMSCCSSPKRECEIWVPKFSFEGEMTLNSELKKMGMVDAFERDQADFSGIDESGGLFVTLVFHKAVLEMEEEGADASATSASSAKDATVTEPVPAVRFDRPFTFHIIDEERRIVLFSGRFIGM